MKIGFDNDKYIEMQSRHILERIDTFGGKLYLEFGGKLFDDYHASRVLPGFAPDSKLKMLLHLRDQVEIVIAINAGDIEKNKVRSDYGITYDLEVLRMIDALRAMGLYVGSIVLTQYAGQANSKKFLDRLETLGLKAYRHYPIEGYPSQVDYIVSPDGFGANEYIQTSRPLVVVTAPGPGSGKMATCLSQLYHEHLRGIKAGYAKFETFPIWNLSLRHPVNIAYEAATADLSDVNMIDPFHLEYYGKMAVNYNRDVEIFPVLQTIFNRIYGDSPYHSPTDMGVNMVGMCISDDDAVCDASKQEVIRRWYNSACAVRRGRAKESEPRQIELLMKRLGISCDDRKVAVAAMNKAQQTGEPAAAIELCDGRVLTGKTSPLLGACSAMLLNALKALAGIDDATTLLSPQIIAPLQELKVRFLGNHNPKLHTDEILLALSVCAQQDPIARKALDQLPKLKGCEAHSSVILSQVDENVFAKLGVNLTCEPQYQSKKLYHK